METKKPAPAASLASLARTVTKILRVRRAATVSGELYNHNDNQILKSSHSEYIEPKPNNIKPQPQEESGSSNSSSSSGRNELDLETLLANLFAAVSAIKAAYAQLQVAESPYDPDTIQSSDKAIVSELKRLSFLKQCYLKKQKLAGTISQSDSQLLAPQLQELRNLLKTYQITSQKLESSLQNKNSEFRFLQSRLLDSTRFNRFLESKLRPNQAFSLDNLNHSLPDPKHFVSVLRSAVKSLRNFVKHLVREMDSAGWDLESAANAIQPVVRNNPEHWTHAFESFVSRCVFSDFHHPDFGISFDHSPFDRRRFFQEFLDLSSGKPVEAAEEMGKFIRSKYLALIHPKMESSFFGDLDRKAKINASEFFALFREMAKRVWILHCLFFSYSAEMDAAIFQVRSGCRFSEVYMESVYSSPAGSIVAFTVVPGFRVLRTLIQCKVYVSGEGR